MKVDRLRKRTVMQCVMKVEGPKKKGDSTEKINGRRKGGHWAIRIKDDCLICQYVHFTHWTVLFRPDLFLPYYLAH